MLWVELLAKHVPDDQKTIHGCLQEFCKEEVLTAKNSV